MWIRELLYLNKACLLAKVFARTRFTFSVFVASFADDRVAQEHIYLHWNGSWITNSTSKCICCIEKRVKFIAKGIGNLLISMYTEFSVFFRLFVAVERHRNSDMYFSILIFRSKMERKREKNIDSEVFWYGIQNTIKAFQSWHKSLSTVDIFSRNCAPLICRFRISNFLHFPQRPLCRRIFTNDLKMVRFFSIWNLNEHAHFML